MTDEIAQTERPPFFPKTFENFEYTRGRLDEAHGTSDKNGHAFHICRCSFRQLEWQAHANYLDTYALRVTNRCEAAGAACPHSNYEMTAIYQGMIWSTQFLNEQECWIAICPFAGCGKICSDS